MQALPQQDQAAMEAAPSEHRQLFMNSASCSRRSDAVLHVERVWLRSSDVGVRVCLEGTAAEDAFAPGNCRKMRKQKVIDPELIQQSQDGPKLRPAEEHCAPGNITYETSGSIARSSNINVVTQEQLAMGTLIAVPEVETGPIPTRPACGGISSYHRVTTSVLQRNPGEQDASGSEVHPPAKEKAVMPPPRLGAFRSPDNAHDTRELMGTLFQEVDADDSREDAEVAAILSGWPSWVAPAAPKGSDATCAAKLAAAFSANHSCEAGKANRSHLFKKAKTYSSVANGSTHLAAQASSAVNSTAGTGEAFCGPSSASQQSGVRSVSVWSHAATLSSLSLDGRAPFAQPSLFAMPAPAANATVAPSSATNAIPAMPVTIAPPTKCTANVAISSSAVISADAAAAAAACRVLPRTAASSNAFLGCASIPDSANMRPSHSSVAPAAVILPASSTFRHSFCSSSSSLASLPAYNLSHPARPPPNQSAIYPISMHQPFSHHLQPVHPCSNQAAPGHASASFEAADGRGLPAQRATGGEASRAHTRTRGRSRSTRGLVGRSASFGEDPAGLKASMPPKRARAC